MGGWWSIGFLQEAGEHLGELASYGTMHRDIGVLVSLSPEVERTYLMQQPLIFLTTGI